MVEHGGTGLTAMGEHRSTNLSSWDLAVPGSPSISRLMSPLRFKPSGSLGGGAETCHHETQYVSILLQCIRKVICTISTKAIDR